MGRPKALTAAERADLLARGYRPAEVWMPDWNDPAFRARLEREAKLVAEADAQDRDIDDWVRQVRGDLWNDAVP